jgi:hypothetical protein
VREQEIERGVWREREKREWDRERKRKKKRKKKREKERERERKGRNRLTVIHGYIERQIEREIVCFGREKRGI